MRAGSLHGPPSGELLGLQWGDIDLGARMLTVRRQLLENADGSLEFGPTKTRGSRRAVALPAMAVEALKSAAINDTDTSVQRAAVNALSDLGTPAARQALLELLNR